MKLLYIAPFPVPIGNDAFSNGGNQKIQITLKLLHELGHEIRIVNSSHTNKRSWFPQINKEHISGPNICYTVYHMPQYGHRKIGKLLQGVFAPVYIRRLARLEKPDLVWIYNCYLFEARSALALAKSRELPFILQLEDLPLAHRRGYFSLKEHFDNVYLPRTLRKAAKVLTVNKNMTAGYSVQENKIVEYPPVIDEALIEMSNHRSDCFSQSKIHIGYFGTLCAEKGVDKICQLYNELPDDFVFHISGSGHMAELIHNMAMMSSGRLVFYGRMSDDDLYQTLCGMDILINPHSDISQMENGVFPFKIMEYMCAKCLIVSTYLPAIGGFDFDGIVFYDGTVTALKASILNAKKQYRSGKAELLRNRAILKFGFSAVKYRLRHEVLDYFV